MALTVENASAEDGANLSLSALTGDTSQKFKLFCNADGSYTILSAASGDKSCADVFEISMNAGANICQWNYWGGDGQKFILEPAYAEVPEEIIGDVNADDAFSVLDVIMLQKWLLNAGDITDAAAGELHEDGVLNAFDLAVMKKMLAEK